MSKILLKRNLLVATLQLKTAPNYQENLSSLISLIKNSCADLMVTPELALTNFDYEHFEEASAFYDVALEELLVVVSDKIVVLTMTKKENNNFYNQAIVLHEHQVIYRQNKHKLFTLGDELKYFRAGEENINSFMVNGICYGVLICFELRFKELWRRLEGVDVVLIPARWGKTRKKHLETLSQALAIMNQSFVILSNSADDDMASSSSIISPWGETVLDDSLEIIEKSIHLKEVKKVRRMIKMK